MGLVVAIEGRQQDRVVTAEHAQLAGDVGRAELGVVPVERRELLVQAGRVEVGEGEVRVEIVERVELAQHLALVAQHRAERPARVGLAQETAIHHHQRLPQLRAHRLANDHLHVLGHAYSPSASVPAPLGTPDGPHTDNSQK
ncbi:hypothetical protein D3C72_808380 [compost metagenome]